MSTDSEPVVYFLALFSIIFHGLSIPALNMAYTRFGVEPLMDDSEQVRRRSVYVATPPNAIRTEQGTFNVFNRFDRPGEHEDQTCGAECHSARQSSDSTNSAEPTSGAGRYDISSSGDGSRKREDHFV